jgi:HSP20 family protein
MAQADWDPLKELTKVQARMNRLFESALARTDFDAEGGIGAWSPIADVYETGSSLVLELELPGLTLEDIDLRMDGDELVVEGERRMDREGSGGEQFHRVERSYGKFARRFPIPSTIERGSVEARYRNGVLTVTLAKKADAPEGPIKVTIR